MFADAISRADFNLMTQIAHKFENIKHMFFFNFLVVVFQTFSMSENTSTNCQLRLNTCFNDKTFST